MKEELSKLLSGYLSTHTCGLDIAVRTLRSPNGDAPVVLVPNPRPQSDVIRGQARFYQFMQYLGNGAPSEWGEPHRTIRGSGNLEAHLAKLEREGTLDDFYTVAVVPTVPPTGAPEFKVYW